MSATSSAAGVNAGIVQATAGTSAEDAGPPAAAGRWWTVIVLTAMYSVSFTDRQVFALLIEPIRKSLGISDFQAGLLHGLAFSVFYVTFGMVFGWAVDRYHRRTIIFAGVTFWSFAATGCGLAANSLQLSLARFGVGAGEASLVPAANSLLADTFPRSRLATALSVFGCGPAIGGTLAFLLGGGLLAILPPEGIVLPFLGLTEPWRVVFIVTGAPGIAVALLVWTFPEPARRQRAPRADESIDYGAALRFMRSRWRFFGAHLTGVGLLCAAPYGLSAWVAVWLMRVHDLEVSQAGLLLAAITVLPGIIGVVGTGMITDRFFARGMRDAHLRVLMFIGVLQMITVVCAAASNSLLATCIFIVLFHFTVGFAGIGPAALQVVTPNEYRGKVTAIYGFSTLLLGFGVGPPFVGALVTYVLGDPAMIGWAVAIAFLILNPLAIAVLWSGFRAMREAVAEADRWEALPAT